jgi:16S rRNA processing protein RimM
MEKSACYKAGYIAKPHALKGELSILLEEDMTSDFDEVEALFIEEEGQLVPYFIEAYSINGLKGILKLEDIDSIEAATSISKKPFFLPKDTREEPEEGEFYDDEIIGVTVYNHEDKALLGKIIDVMKAGPNKLLVLDYQGKEVLIPVNSPFIVVHDKAQNHIEVQLPEGFLDI